MEEGTCQGFRSTVSATEWNQILGEGAKKEEEKKGETFFISGELLTPPLQNYFFVCRYTGATELIFGETGATGGRVKF